jgi:hypothetical protein
MGVTGPLFAQTMFDGIDGALEAVSRETAYDESESGRNMIALVNYCTESWASQFIPTPIGAIARTADDTVRTYDGSNDSAILGGLKYSIQKRIPGWNQQLPAKLDMWGQPMKSGSTAERLLENFISPGYYEANNTDPANEALVKFAENNNIPYAAVVPEAPSKNVTLANKTQIELNAKEYEYYAGEIGKARKKVVEDYLINNKPAEVELTIYSLDSENKNGLTSKGGKILYTGKINNATNNVGWFPTNGTQGYVTYGDDGKAVKIQPVDDATFRVKLFDTVMKAATDEAADKAKAKIKEDRENAKE